MYNRYLVFWGNAIGNNGKIYYRYLSIHMFLTQIMRQDSGEEIIA
jgi:hypothetical protein